MNIEALTGALDRAITKVADRQFLKLSSWMPRLGWSNRIRPALDSLAQLQQGNPPNYDDPWTALFYLTWYQPGQIQLAHLMVEGLKQARGNESLLANGCRSLHVVDFGCGALAMQFAVSWAAADALERQEPISSIKVDSYDANPAMLDLGNILWEQFKEEVKYDRRLGQLSKSAEMIEARCGKPESLFPYRTLVEEERWLSAIHAVDSSNVEQAKGGLAKICDITKPDVGFLSGNTQQGDLLQQTSPFNSPQYKHWRPGLVPLFENGLPKITQWRRSLNTRMIPGHIFLSNEVTWGFPSALGWGFTKSD
jgi:hypothetical protein